MFTNESIVDSDRDESRSALDDLDAYVADTDLDAAVPSSGPLRVDDDPWATASDAPAPF